MDLIVTILFGALALYGAIGLVVAPAFVIFGLTAVQVAATVGARILFLPGAVALWPIVLSRWLRARNAA
jgi:ABC-type siderophore export system fused ATPase/permease subunit